MGQRNLSSLIDDAASGDAAAYDQVARRFAGMAFAYAYAVLRDFHLAQDAAQEALIEAYFSLPSLKDRARFPAWLRTIVRRRCARFLRRARLPVTGLDAATDVEAGLAGPPAAAQAKETAAVVHAALDALPLGERAAASLFYVDGYSHAQIARFLSIPATAVKSRLHSAREKIRRRMMTMVKDTLHKNAPDDSLARKVSQAIKVYAAKGPSENATRSPWAAKVRRQTARLLESGGEGFKVAEALSESQSAAAREKAALHFGLSGDARALTRLRLLLGDRAARVRRLAVRAYAQALYGSQATPGGLGIGNTPGKRVESMPEGLLALEPLLSDSDLKTRWYAVHALGASAGLDPAVDAALEKALCDPAHKVRHAAAGWLRRACPTCGTRPDAKARVGEDRECST